MNNEGIAMAIVMALGTRASVSADTVEHRPAHLEAMTAEIEGQIFEQEPSIQQQARTIAATNVPLEGAPERLKELEQSSETERGDDAAEHGWHRNIELTGLVELEASYSSPHEGDDQSDISLATIELGVIARITDWVEAGMTLLYEEDETPLEVDIAYVTIGNAEKHPLFMTAGQIYVPFGAYKTYMVSDPLTLEIGETRETAWQVGFVADHYNGSLYLFDGDNEKEGRGRIATWGANLGLTRESGDVGWAAGIGYLSDLGDSDALQGVIADNLGDNDSDFVPAWTANATAKYGRISLIGEYLAATESFSPPPPFLGRPSAWNLELGYDFEMFRKAATFAIGFQGTRESLALELPKQRILVALSTEIYDRTSLSLEWAHDKDYDVAEGGSGKSANSVVAQMVVEF